MKKIKIENAPLRQGSGYPEPYDQPCRSRTRRRLGNAAGLTQFGVNLLHLPPGAWSSQRHWHETEDEFVWVLEGEVVLVTNAGEEILRVGDCAGFKAGDPDGHHLQNRSSREAVILEIGTRNPKGDGVDYPDIDLAIRTGSPGFVHKDGKPYPPQAHK
ncbi:MAG: cupin domain-containing protein [Gammaproteobacteria bacterium]|nr:cupin domain-containing protein [Gammaproteobacteria bacterium]MDE1888005.1 cupin domain-containing protein [Gammaproteobacteria bacterium]MDE2022896.1 cupin domain-containing protein [Gammaproteobacteria bacterium]MDE2140414.1 cupin domain-containing protein [Gammaproteobacteria bacterium]MDE2274650.1 cupin domain-containing protein [Gammaproteobacteria bacterium]